MILSENNGEVTIVTVNNMADPRATLDACLDLSRATRQDVQVKFTFMAYEIVYYITYHMGEQRPTITGVRPEKY